MPIIEILGFFITEKKNVLRVFLNKQKIKTWKKLYIVLKLAEKSMTCIAGYNGNTPPTFNLVFKITVFKRSGLVKQVASVIV